MENNMIENAAAVPSERLKKQEKILEAAENLFVEKGLAETTMSEIAEAAEISRRTLYRYYASKEDLAFAVEGRIFILFYHDLEKNLKHLSGTGYEKLAWLLKSLPLYIEEHKKEVKFTGVFDHYFAGEYPGSPESEKFIQIIQEDGNPVAEIIRQGIQDGSIRKNIDAFLTARTIGNTIISLAQRIIIRGHHIEKEQSVAPRAIMEQLMEMILESLRPLKE